MIWACVGLAVIATQNLLDSRTGRAIRALRGGGVAAESFGVSTMRGEDHRVRLRGMLAGVAGWLYAHMQRAVNATPFGINAGIEYLLMAVLGGAGNVAGALLGSTLVTLLKDQLQRILPALFGAKGNYELIIFGALLVVLLQTAREGLWPKLAALVPSGPPPPRPAPAEALPRREMPVAGAPLLSLNAARKEFGGLVAVNDVSFDVKAAISSASSGPTAPARAPPSISSRACSR